MWLAKPASLQSASKQKNPRRQQYICDGKNCQSIKFIKPVYEDQKCQSTVCSDKNCQDNKCVNMQPVKPEMHMQSIEPASCKKMCNDKNSQSTRCYKKSV